MKVVYIACAFSAPTLEEMNANRARAAKWVAWAAVTQNVSPVCSWIVLTGELPETPEMRKLGLEIDKAQVKRCDELWHVGGRVSSGMAIEASVAKKVVDLTHLGEWPPGYEPGRTADTEPAPPDAA